MPKIKPKSRSSRRVPPPQESDFDHEIGLVDGNSVPGSTSDHDTAGERAEGSSTAAHPSSAPEGESSASASNPLDDQSRVQVQTSDMQREDGDGSGTDDVRPVPTGPSVLIEQPTPQIMSDQPAKTGKERVKVNGKTSPTAIDILYENQRGGFLCGMALFSSKALGNLDPPPWTNSLHKPSPTDIHTAQVPDPSWQWLWPEWRVNHDQGTDEEGWEYSFMFAKCFSWHGPAWWNSFVRRRAWIRKRGKKDEGYDAQDGYMLNPDYFSVRPSSELSRERSPSRVSGSHRDSRVSLMSRSGGDDSEEKPEIRDIEDLLGVLRTSRIDREKIEAVDDYLEHGTDLEHLQDKMHEIMSLFVFQASRRVLLTRLTEVYEGISEKLDQSPSGRLQETAGHLAAAVKHADEEVRRLEYWSDVKGMAEEGESKGAVDQNQGWDVRWQGVDRSGPAQPSAPSRS